MRICALIFILIATRIVGQDKIYLSDGTFRKGIFLSASKEYIVFKEKGSPEIKKINIKEVLLLSRQDSTRYVFKTPKSHNNEYSKNKVFRNYIGTQPISIIYGRLTFCYERLSKDGKIGVMIPFILTFDPVGVIYPALDSNVMTESKHAGINFITGADLNFYAGKKERLKFFVGPRLRYGTDVFFDNTEGYTIQTQFGWRISRPERRRVHHISVGYGIVRFIASSAGKYNDPRQSFGWISLNYRLGFKL
jgi:hypothetical protein